MSWFKKEVDDWDMVGKALKRSISQPEVPVLDFDAEDTDEDDLKEVDLNILRAKEAAEAEKNKQQANVAKKLLTGD